MTVTRRTTQQKQVRISGGGDGLHWAVPRTAIAHVLPYDTCLSVIVMSLLISRNLNGKLKCYIS